MIKALATIVVAAGLIIGGKVPGDIFFSTLDKPLNVIQPYKEASFTYEAGKRIYFYIYSKKPLETDRLYLLFILIDNKTLALPKSDIEQTLDIDITPGSEAIKGNVVLFKPGPYLVRVYNPNRPKDPIAEGQFWIVE